MTDRRVLAGGGSPSGDAQDAAPEAAASVLARLAAVRGEGAADGGRVRVVLDGSGDLLDLVIDPQSMRGSSAELAAAVRAAFGQARADVARQVQDEAARRAFEAPLSPTAVRGLEDVALSAHRKLAEMTALVTDLAGRLGHGERER